MTDHKTDKMDPSGMPKVARDPNTDPISGAPGSHPIGVGAGSAGGAAAGAAIGTAVGGPVGFVVGGVTGAVVGGLAGKGVAEMVDPTGEDAYWRANFASRPYVNASDDYETLKPAYKYGWESRSKMNGRSWQDAESDLSSGWEQARGESKMAWTDAKRAAEDAWTHADGGLDGDRMPKR